jgi:hypothetical protein
MTDTPTNQDFVAIGFNGKGAKAWEPVCAWLLTFCEKLPETARLSTRDLLTQTGVEGTRAAVQALWRIRKEEGVPADCWEQDPTKRFMGNPLILWKNPSKVDTSIF